VWDDEPPARRDRNGDDANADDDRPGLWSGNDDDSGHPDSGHRDGGYRDGGRRDRGASWADATKSGPQTPRGRATLLIVVTVVLLATVVLCCVAISQAATLFSGSATPF
jgi:hypothetical protein